MKINSYQIGMDSAGTYRSTLTRKYNLSFSKEGGFGSLIENGTEEGVVEGSESEDYTDTSLMDRYDSMYTDFNDRIKQVDQGDTLKSIDQVRERFVLYLWRIFFGQEKSDEMARKFGFEPLSSDISSGVGMSPGFSVIKINGVQECQFEETEELSYMSSGSITTEDGRSIDFSLSIGMSRSFSAHYREEFHDITAMCDPLVLNFTGDIADLSDQKFYFDLDADGNEEEISTLLTGNGFLAFDKNGDGIINDGRELFGTRSGDGFADLAFYDSDSNGWIDENDGIYDKLKIWIKDADGNDILYSLRDKNVGAIYLDNVDTNYGRRSDITGDLNGAVRRSGIFLYEDGSGAGAISHLDMAVG
ncbi:MAG: hypothetical protein K6E68_08880 [Lachnospiraceae bacterium]|nr:hypothetical protein [Lachnospiraceae bacterium]